MTISSKRIGNTIRSAIFLLFCGLLAPFAAQAAYDDSLEKQWRQALQRIEPGRLVELTASSRKFIGLYLPTTAATRLGRVVIVHDIGQHPDWQAVTRPLRIGLARHGWDTLSIQMPVLGPERKTGDYLPLFTDATARIDAAVGWLKKNGKGGIVLIGHGLGAWMALSAVSAKPKPAIDGLALIGLDAPADEPKQGTDTLIRRLALPVLDILGDNDRPAMAGIASRRRAAQRAGLKIPSPHQPDTGNAATWRVVVIDGADHDFTGQTDILIDRLRGWIRRLPAWRK